MRRDLAPQSGHQVVRRAGGDSGYKILRGAAAGTTTPRAPSLCSARGALITRAVCAGLDLTRAALLRGCLVGLPVREISLLVFAGGLLRVALCEERIGLGRVRPGDVGDSLLDDGAYQIQVA